MSKIMSMVAGFGALFSVVAQANQPVEVTMHKDPFCGCCTEYAHYLEENGYKVTLIDHSNMLPIKQKLGTDKAASCHTLEIENYVVEGHVPVAAIERMLKEQPDIKGIALPGMPINSPGMGPEKKGSLRVLKLDHSSNPSGLYMHL